ncbi:tRNA-dependent cyclodipeptide synthase [Streptomyces caeruleatus]|uniref:tRNA-dependent cyclodipeptide synthase n=1 Tax=Streptomyces caeruleatus TaxID=661399 RepID=UPI001FC955B9|nr:tRNA-dependent cyclodipeptide synthase [Streptomyces caeruleatus]
MSNIEVMLGQIVPAAGAAVAVYGAAVLRPVEDEAAGATVRLGQRLLAHIRGRAADPAAIDGAVTDLATDPDDPDALAALRLQIRRALAADPSLVHEIAALLPAAGHAQSGGARSVAVSGSVSGIVSTGDGAMNIQRQ